MKIYNLIITQSNLRHPQEIQQMTAYVKNGGVFDHESICKHSKKHSSRQLAIDTLIQISEFEDGKQYIHNGHHRCLAIYLGKRDHLLPEEFEITKWKYSDYTDVVFYKDNKWMGWLTPYDPRTHVRVPEIWPFKKMAQDVYKKSGEQAALDFIDSHLDDFRIKRACSILEEFKKCLV